MGFMIVNTGRAASRAFHLNLRAQKDLFAFSRSQFDCAVTDRIAHGSTKGLDDLATTLETATTVRSTAPTVGVVFHGVRPRLAFPFESDDNIDLLTHVRDRLGIETALLVVRDPHQVLRSEINRRLAGLVGDWVFPDLGMGWKHSFTPEEVASLPSREIPEPPDVEAELNVEVRQLAIDIAERTGKVASLHRLFATVFPDVQILPYERLVDDPAATFTDIARVGGFTFADDKLVGTTLNGLANRFLTYNPVILDLGGGRSARLRFEIADVIGLCEDWGRYAPLAVDATPHMPATHQGVGSPIGVGIDTEHLAGLTSAERRMFEDPTFAQRLGEGLGPVFDANLAVMNRVYRDQVHLATVPVDAFDAYMEINGAEVAATQELLRGAHVAAGA